MNEEDFEERLLKKLEEDLEEYDKIFLVSGSEGVQGELVKGLCSGREAGKQKKRILVLSSEKTQAGKAACVTYRQITEEEEERLGRLYFLYEFSDRFLLLSDKGTYGSLFRLIETGLLETEEALEALLY